MPTSNKDMGNMLRQRRREMEEIPEIDVYTGPEKTAVAVKEPNSESEPPKGMTVAAPGEPSTGDVFEYEPLPDAPGAWVVYPPGVPCDDTVHRIQMSRPASEGDFARMQTMLDEAGATSEMPEEPVDLDMDEEEIY